MLINHINKWYALWDKVGMVIDMIHQTQKILPVSSSKHEPKFILKVLYSNDDDDDDRNDRENNENYIHQLFPGHGEGRRHEWGISLIQHGHICLENKQ